VEALSRHFRYPGIPTNVFNNGHFGYNWPLAVRSIFSEEELVNAEKSSRMVGTLGGMRSENFTGKALQFVVDKIDKQDGFDRLCLRENLSKDRSRRNGA